LASIRIKRFVAACRSRRKEARGRGFGRLAPTDLDTTDPNATDPNATAPNATDLDAIDLDAIDLDAIAPHTTDPDAIEAEGKVHRRQSRRRRFQPGARHVRTRHAGRATRSRSLVPAP
jgi:hypothetical protein